MARLARSTVPGYPHHVLQRGNRDQQVFESEADYRRYLEWLREYATRYGVDIGAYCLMPNHVHVICVPRSDGALTRTFNTTHMRYAQYFNGKREATGPLWRARFMSCILDGPSVLEEVRFIETNPVRARLVSPADAYPWSSARSHVTGEPDPLLSKDGLIQVKQTDWASYLAESGEEFIIRRVRERLRTGRPAGEPEFVRVLEDKLGRSLQAKSRGRPRTVVPVPPD